MSAREKEFSTTWQATKRAERFAARAAARGINFYGD